MTRPRARRERRFEKLQTPEKARRRRCGEGPKHHGGMGHDPMTVEKIKFYVDSVRPEQLMLNIASAACRGKVLKSMRLCAEEVMPAVSCFFELIHRLTLPADG